MGDGGASAQINTRAYSSYGPFQKISRPFPNNCIWPCLYTVKPKPPCLHAHMDPKVPRHTPHALVRLTYVWNKVIVSGGGLNWPKKMGIWAWSHVLQIGRDGHWFAKSLRNLKSDELQDWLEVRAGPVREALCWSRWQGRLGSVLSRSAWLAPSGSRLDNKHSLNSYSTHHTVLGTTGDLGQKKEKPLVQPPRN